MDLKLFLIYFTILFAPIQASNLTVATMVIGEEYGNMVLPGIPNKARYCRHHGYNFALFTETMDATRPIPWTKIKIIQYLFKNPKVKWVFWSDADSLFMNSHIKLKRFLDKRYDLILASDDNGINSGQFFIRNCEWSKKFLADVYNQEQFINHGWWEQKAIMHLYETKPKIHKHIKILPQRCINSYAPEVKSDPNMCWQEGDFILHFAGQKGQGLTDFMNKYSEMAK